MAGVRLTEIPSVILDTRKKAYREPGAVLPHAPADTLEHIPYIESKLNEISRLHILSQRGELPLNLSTGKPIVDLLEEQPTRVIFKTSVPIKGKTAFTVLHRLSRPLHEMRRTIAEVLQLSSGASQRSTLPAPVSIHRADTLEQLDEALTFLELGFRFVPVLHLKGFSQEYTLRTAGSASRMAIEWSPHHTVTELVKEVWRRLRPYDLRLCRLSTVTVPPGMDEPKIFRIDTSRSFAYNDEAGALLEPTTRLCDVAAFASSNSAVLPAASDPFCALFFRTKEGKRIWFDLAEVSPLSTGTAVICGSTTVREVGDLMLALEKRRKLETIMMMEPPAVNSEATGAGVSNFERGGEQEQLMALLESELPFDDADEEISPGAERRVYFHGFLPQMTFSFNPPESVANQFQRGPAKFVSIDEDYCIGHLSDCGIFPLSEVMVEYFDPHTQHWSGDVAAALDAEESSGLSASDLLTVRCDRGQVLRIPASPSTTVATLLRRVFCAVGLLPMFTLLRTSTGRILQEYETLLDAQLLPHATLYASHRPRAWLGETLRCLPVSEFGLPDPL
jgi:hypothetical protein